MFIETLFTTAKTWKQPKCPSTDEWIKKSGLRTMEYVKRKKILPFTDNMDGS